MEDIKLNDLQKLAVHLLGAATQLTALSINTGNPLMTMHAEQHLELARSILGDDIMEAVISDPDFRDEIFEQASDFKNLMMPEPPDPNDFLNFGD